MYDKQVQCRKCQCTMTSEEKYCPKCGCNIKPSYKRWWFWIMLAVLLAALIMLIMNLSGANKTEPPMPESSSESEVTEPKVYAVGDTAEMKVANVTFEEITEYPGTKFNQPDEGKIFLILEFTIKNKTDKDMIISSKMSFETLVDGNEVTMVSLSTKETGGKARLDGIIPPKKSMNGVLVYQVPLEYKEVKVTFKPIDAGGEEAVFVYNK